MPLCRRRFLSGTHEAALGVVGTGGGDGQAACASLAAALSEDPTLRLGFATVAARCR